MKIIYHHRTRATDAQRVHILEIVNAFRELGHEVEIVSLVDTEAPSDGRKEAEEPAWIRLVHGIPFAYEVVQIGYNFVGLPILVAKLHGPNVSFVYERYSLFNFAGVLAARLTRKPIVLEVNSPFAIEQKEERAIRAVRLALWMERIVLNAATAVVVVSGPLRKILIEQGVDAAKLALIPNAANLHHLKAAPSETDELRKQLGLENKCTIGFVGWFKSWHGLEFLIDAFHASGLRRRDAALLLIGDGPAMADLKRRVAGYDLAGSVVFGGPVPHERIAPYLDLIDIAVQPAANEYCCPMKILEYMALGKPIIAPRQENICELLEDGSEALLFQPGSTEELGAALTRLVGDVPERRRMGEDGRRAINRRGFLWTRNAERVIDLVCTL